ncbi:MAG: nickel pincer cofactor biosynthesis protein LarB [Pirellulales bacterium]
MNWPDGCSTATSTAKTFCAQVAVGHTASLVSATVDMDRAGCGYPEVIFGENKSAESIGEIAATILAAGHDVLATRIAEDKAARLAESFPVAQYNAVGRTWRVVAGADAANDRSDAAATGGRVTIVTAGTSDLPVAEEARETAEWMGAEVRTLCDVGVAGPHRLPAHLDRLAGADAVVVIAGMEGALPSVVGGYVACPVIAVPTSVGYGAAFGGLAALLGMLNSCASNVSVVNIDAGFKGAYIAGLIARNAAVARRRAT